MKRVYSTPKASIESFMVNNYIAAVCYTLACDIDAANGVEKNTYHTYSADPKPGTNQVNHSKGGCGSASSQYISISDSGSVSIKEYNTQLGWLDCTVTTAGGADAISAGDYVYWTTSASNNRVWHHQGQAEALFPGHPNRS